MKLDETAKLNLEGNICINSPFPLLFLPELLQREQAEMAQQLANLQTDVRVSYGNDALMPDQELGDGQTDLLPQEDTAGGVGFIHPESFNQLNTDNQGTSL